MKHDKAIERVADDLDRIRGLIEDTGETARNLTGLTESDTDAARRAMARLLQFEDIALQLVEQARSHLREIEGAPPSSRVVEQHSLDPGDVELF